jgi:hypothetical protein
MRYRYDSPATAFAQSAESGYDFVTNPQNSDA